MISGADSISVTTFDGAEFAASAMGSYEDGDIAVLKIEAEGLLENRSGFDTAHG